MMDDETYLEIKSDIEDGIVHEWEIIDSTRRYSIEIESLGFGKVRVFFVQRGLEEEMEKEEFMKWWDEVRSEQTRWEFA